MPRKDNASPKPPPELSGRLEWRMQQALRRKMASLRQPDIIGNPGFIQKNMDMDQRGFMHPEKSMSTYF